MGIQELEKKLKLKEYKENEYKNILVEVVWRWLYLFETTESELSSLEPKVVHNDSCGLTTLSPKTLYIFHFGWNSFQEHIHISIFLKWVVCICSHIEDKTL
jgi:hypothetical protein